MSDIFIPSLLRVYFLRNNEENIDVKEELNDKSWCQISKNVDVRLSFSELNESVQLIGELFLQIDYIEQILIVSNFYL